MGISSSPWSRSQSPSSMPSWLAPQSTLIWKMLRQLKRKSRRKTKGHEGGGPFQETPHPPVQRVNAVYTPLTIPITQSLMAVEGKGLLTCPRSWKDSPQRPKSDKFCRLHKDYDHTTEECRHLKDRDTHSKWIFAGIAMLGKSQRNRTLSKARKRKTKETKAASPEHFPKEGTKCASGNKGEINDPPRKVVIRMIVGGSMGGDSHHARNSQVREAHDVSWKEVLDVETMEDAPLSNLDEPNDPGQRLPITMP
ncbi:UNVERIFIED_CONTAM: hypothetical protein Sradi_5693800 [Sesamum radiatum]|uniref:Uncharacterized protein n=1 Tax=Sesamum radiatum TaxID=300843 RepID=A0AAW2L124_SESRA